MVKKILIISLIVIGIISAIPIVSSIFLTKSITCPAIAKTCPDGTNGEPIPFSCETKCRPLKECGHLKGPCEENQICIKIEDGPGHCYKKEINPCTLCLINRLPQEECSIGESYPGTLICR